MARQKRKMLQRWKRQLLLAHRRKRLPFRLVSPFYFGNIESWRYLEHSASNTMLLLCIHPHDSREQGTPFRVEECPVFWRTCQFVVSGAHFSMNFLLLCIQSTVCVVCVATVKKFGIISFRSFDMQDAKAWFPISFLLVTVIYTGSKSLVGSFVWWCRCRDVP